MAATADEYERLLSDGDNEDTGSGSDDRDQTFSEVEEEDDDLRSDVERPGRTKRRRLVPLRARLKFAYGLGHVFNDISAAIWFSYTMVFVQNVIGVPSTVAGFLMFFGIPIIIHIQLRFKTYMFSLVQIPFGVLLFRKLTSKVDLKILIE